jgi:hypothetical protein
MWSTAILASIGFAADAYANKGSWLAVTWPLLCAYLYHKMHRHEIIYNDRIE